MFPVLFVYPVQRKTKDLLYTYSDIMYLTLATNATIELSVIGDHQAGSTPSNTNGKPSVIKVKNIDLTCTFGN